MCRLRCSHSLGQYFNDAGRQSDQNLISCSCRGGVILGQETLEIGTFDPTFESGRRRKARGAPLFSQEDLDEINPSTELVAFDTLLQDESLSEDVREIMRMKYE